MEELTQDSRLAQEVYGDKPYYSFAEEFEEAHSKWDTKEWGKLFSEARARYVVLTSKHHDGYTLWYPPLKAQPCSI